MQVIAYRTHDELYHHGIKGQKWGVRRYQNSDGSLTSEGRMRYGSAADYATPDKKAQKDYYKAVKKTWDQDSSRGFDLLKKATPEEVKTDMVEYGKKSKEALHSYSKEYEKEMDKCLNDSKKLKKYTESLGWDKEKNPAQFESFTMKKRFILGYVYGDDVLHKIDHSTTALKNKKEAAQKARTDVIKESQDYSEKLLGEFGDKTLKYVHRYGQYKYTYTMSAKSWVAQILQSHASLGILSTPNKNALFKKYGITDSDIRTFSNELKTNEHTVSNMPVSELRKLLK